MLGHFLTSSLIRLELRALFFFVQNLQVAMLEGCQIPFDGVHNASQNYTVKGYQEDGQPPPWKPLKH
jgi:hypothetical protein